MSRTLARENTRLDLSRHAARLFLAKGVAGTSGEEIAAEGPAPHCSDILMKSQADKARLAREILDLAFAPAEVVA